MAPSVIHHILGLISLSPAPRTHTTTWIIQTHFWCQNITVLTRAEMAPSVIHHILFVLSLALTHTHLLRTPNYAHVGGLNLWYKSVNFGVKIQQLLV